MFDEKTVQTSNRNLSSMTDVRNLIDILRNQIESADNLNFETCLEIERNAAGHTVYK